MKKLKQLTVILLSLMLLVSCVETIPDDTRQGGMSETTAKTPAPIASFAAPEVLAFSAGLMNSAAVLEDGSLWMWGWNYSGESGADPYYFLVEEPHKVMEDVRDVSCGRQFTLAVKNDNSLWGWGLNSSGELSYASDNPHEYVPVELMGEVKVAVAGNGYALAVRTDGTLWGWGLGSPSVFGPYKTPMFSQFAENISDVTLGLDHAAALTTDGTLLIWGLDWEKSSQEMQTQQTRQKEYGGSKPADVIIPNVTAVASGDEHCLYVMEDGGLWLVEDSTAPVRLMDDVTAVSAGNGFSLAVKSDGTLWSFGVNHKYQLGDGTNENRTEPVQILTDVKAVSSGREHALAVKSDGSLWGWGDNSFAAVIDYVESDDVTGELNFYQSVPVQLLEGIDLNAELPAHQDKTPQPEYIVPDDFATEIRISSGRVVLYLASDGTVLQLNDNLSLRNDSDIRYWTGIVDIGTGVSHAIGLRGNGTVVGVDFSASGRDSEAINVSEWRNIVAIDVMYNNTVGLRSDGTVVTTRPVQSDEGQADVGDWTDIVAIAAGSYCTYGIKSDGTVVATGYNGFNQLEVGDWTDIIAIKANQCHTVGLRSDGTVVAIGENNNKGQLEVGDWTNIIEVGAGFAHTVGLRADGTVVAVGDNSNGQCDVSDWTDIVAISVGHNNTVGLKSDGSVVWVGVE